MPACGKCSIRVGFYFIVCIKPSQVALMIKNLPANAGDVRNADSIPGSRRSPAGGHGNLLWYSYLEYPMDRGTWRAMAYRVAKSRTRLKQLRTHGEESQLQSPNRKSETQRKEIVSTRSIHRGMSQPKSSWGTFALSRWGNCLPVGLSFLICAVGLCVFEGRQLYHIAPGWSLSSQPP